jgi:phage regulator Rha-like protein
MLEIQNVGGQLLVDSRLVAEALGILHKSFKETISKYTERLESLVDEALNPVAGENRSRLLRETSPKLSDGTGGEVYYLLNENQATFLMTLSSNTEQVVEAKFNLVKAFANAKTTLLTQYNHLQNIGNIIQQMATELQQQREAINLLTERTQRLDKLEQQEREFDRAAEIQPGCADILVDQLENEIDNRLMTAIDFCSAYGIDNSQSRRIAHWAGGFQRGGKNVKACPKQQGTNRNLLELRYLKRAAKIVLGLE